MSYIIGLPGMREILYTTSPLYLKYCRSKVKFTKSSFFNILWVIWINEIILDILFVWYSSLNFFFITMKRYISNLQQGYLPYIPMHVTANVSSKSSTAWQFQIGVSVENGARDEKQVHS